VSAPALPIGRIQARQSRKATHPAGGRRYTSVAGGRTWTVRGLRSTIARITAASAIESSAGRVSQCGADKSQLAAIQRDVPISAVLLARSRDVRSVES